MRSKRLDESVTSRPIGARLARWRSVLPGTLAVVGFGVSLLASTAAAQPDELAAARARWEAAGLDAYAYGYRKFCECNPKTPPETIVSVTNGVVTNVVHRPVDSDRELPADAEDFQWYWTIEDLFGLVERAEARQSTVRVAYDPVLGHPTTLYIDHDAELFGDEIDLRLTGVVATAR